MINTQIITHTFDDLSVLFDQGNGDFVEEDTPLANNEAFYDFVMTFQAEVA